MTDWENYESGPFCRHWGDPADCDAKCANCGHICRVHEFESPGECVDGRDGDCDCKEWKEES